MLATLISILWGGNLVSVKIGLDVMPPFWSAFWRMALGVVTVSLCGVARGVSLRMAPGERRYLIGLGMLFAVQIALMNSAMQLTSPGYGVVILNSYAVFANLIGHFSALEERLNGIRIVGLVLALGGMLVLSVGQPGTLLAPNPLVGNALLVVSAVLLGLRQVYTRWLVQNVDPIRAVVWQMAWSLPVFLVMAAATEPMLTGKLTWPPVAAIVYQGVVVAGVCFVGWAELLKKYSAGSVSMYAFLVPFAGVALSAALFGEKVNAGLVTGIVLVTAGVAIVTRAGGSRRGG